MMMKPGKTMTVSHGARMRTSVTSLPSFVGKRGKTATCTVNWPVCRRLRACAKAIAVKNHLANRRSLVKARARVVSPLLAKRHAVGKVRVAIRAALVRRVPPARARHRVPNPLGESRVVAHAARVPPRQMQADRISNEYGFKIVYALTECPVNQWKRGRVV